MANRAKRPEGDRARQPGTKNRVEEHGTTSPVESLNKAQSEDPVRSWRRVARHMSVRDLLVWRAQVIAVLTFAAFESPKPEHDRQVVRWQIEAIDAELTARERRKHLPVRTIGGFPDEFISDLKQRMPLYALMQDTGDILWKSGKEYRGDCPFHQSKSGTSLTVSEDVFYCFGCQRGGDVYTWIMDRWELEFPDAVGVLARMAGVELLRPTRLVCKPKRRAVSRA